MSNEVKKCLDELIIIMNKYDLNNYEQLGVSKMLELAICETIEFVDIKKDILEQNF